MRTILAAGLGVVLLAGCSSSGGTTTATSPTPTPSSSAFTATAGQDAALIARHIPGCTGVAAGSVGKGGPILQSTATCTLDGHLVIVDSFSSSADALDVDELTGDELWYAYGSSGWLAFLADQGATADQTTLQMQLTNDAGALTQEGIGGDTRPVASANAQKTLTKTIADALGGTQRHALPTVQPS